MDLHPPCATKRMVVWQPLCDTVAGLPRGCIVVVRDPNCMHNLIQRTDITYYLHATPPDWLLEMYANQHIFRLPPLYDVTGELVTCQSAGITLRRNIRAEPVETMVRCVNCNEPVKNRWDHKDRGCPVYRTSTRQERMERLGLSRISRTHAQNRVIDTRTTAERVAALDRRRKYTDSIVTRNLEITHATMVKRGKGKKRGRPAVAEPEAAPSMLSDSVLEVIRRTRAAEVSSIKGG